MDHVLLQIFIGCVDALLLILILWLPWRLLHVPVGAFYAAGKLELRDKGAIAHRHCDHCRSEIRIGFNVFSDRRFDYCWKCEKIIPENNEESLKPNDKPDFDDVELDIPKIANVIRLSKHRVGKMDAPAL